MTKNWDRPPRLRFVRGAGNTTAMLNGAKNTSGVMIVAHRQDFARELAAQCDNAIPVSLYDVERRMFGFAGPVLIDHHALDMVFTMWERYVSDLEEKITKLEDELARARKIECLG